MASPTAPSGGADSEPNDKEIKAAGSTDPLESTDTTATSSKDVVEKFIQEVLRPNIPSSAATAGSDQVANQIKDIVNPPANARADQSGLKPDTKAALNLQQFIRQLVTDKGLKGAADLLKGMSPADRAKLGGWDIQVSGTPENPTFAIKKGGADVTSVRGSDIQIGDGPVNMTQLAGRTAERFDLLAQNPKFLKAALTGLTALLDKERQPGGSLADPAAFNAFINAFNSRMGPGKMELSATDKGLTLKKVPGVTGDVTSDYTAAKTAAGDISTGDTSGLRNYLKASQSRITDLAALAAQPGVDPLQLSEKFSAVLRGEFARTGADPAKLVDSINAGMPPAGVDGTKYAARFDAAKGQIVFEKVDSTGKALQVLRRVAPENLPAIDLKTAPPDVIAKRMAASSAEIMGLMTDSQRDAQLARANQWLKGKPDLAPQFFSNLNQELASRPETAALKTRLKPADAAAGSGPEVSIEKAATATSLDILDVPLPNLSGDVPDPVKQAIQQLDTQVPNMKRFTDAITDPTKLAGYKAGDTILRIAPNGQDRISAVVSAVDATGKPTEISVQLPVPPGQQGPPQTIKLPFERFVAETNGLGDKSVFVGFRPKTAADAPRTTDGPVPAAPVDLAKIMGPEAFAKLTEPQKQGLAVLFDANASPDAKLKAAEALFASGMRNFKINDNGDKQRTVTLQKSGIMMHVFTTDDRGRTTIAIRGVKRGDTYQQQVDKRGKPVSFVGDHFLKNGGENSVLNGKGTDAPTRPSDQPLNAATTMKPNDVAAFNASLGKIFSTSEPANLANRSVVGDFTNFVKASDASQDTPEVKAKAQQEALLAAIRAEAALYPKATPQEIAAKFKTALGDQAAKFNLDAINADVLSPSKYFAGLVKAAKTPGEVARLFTNFTRIENARTPATSALELQKRLNDALVASGTDYNVQLQKYGTTDDNLILYRKNAAGAQEVVSRIDPRHIQIPGQQENVLQLAGRLAEPLSALKGDELKSYWQQVTSTMKDLDPAKRELLVKSIQAELAKRPESRHLTITPNADSLSLNSNIAGKTEAVASARYDAVVAPESVVSQTVAPGGAADLKKILGDQQLAAMKPEQLAALQAFFKPGAKPEEQLAAAKALVAAGIKSLKIQDGDKSRTLSFQVEKAGKRSKDSYVHVYATDDKGKSRIAIRGISDDKGAIRQQGKASYYGDVWTRQIGNKSILSGATAPAGPGTPQEVPKPATPLSPLFKADQIKWDATAPVEPVNPAIEPIASPATVTGAPFDAALAAKSLIDAGLDGGFFTGTFTRNKDYYDRIKSLFLNRTPDQLKQMQAEFFKQTNGVSLESAMVKRFGADSGEFMELRRLSEGDAARLARIQGNLKSLASGTNVWQVEKDLRDTFGSMTKENFDKFNEDFKKQNGGTSLTDALAQAKGMTDATRKALEILTKYGADGLKPEQVLQLSKIATDAGDLDMFKETWRRASPEARQQFMANNGEAVIRSKWGPLFGIGPYTQKEQEALDYAKLGTLSARTEIAGNIGFWGDTEAGIEAAIDKMSPEQRNNYILGKELEAKVAKGTIPEPTDVKQKAAIDYYRSTFEALKVAADNAAGRGLGPLSMNYRELQAYEDRIKFGKKGSFVSDVINKDGYSGKSEDQILAAIDTMSQDRWEHAKKNREVVEADLKKMLESTLTGILGTDNAAVERVMAAFRKKMDAGDYAAAQKVSRTLAERMDAKKGGFMGWGTDHGAILDSIVSMDQDFMTRYRSEDAFRAQVDKSLSDGSLTGPELVAATRMLQRVKDGGEPKPDILDRLAIANAKGTPINDLVTELDKLMREDPKAFETFKGLSGKVAGYDLASIRRELIDKTRDNHDGTFFQSFDYLKFLMPMLEQGRRLDESTRMQMYMGMFGNDMEGVTKAVVAGGPELWEKLKTNPDLMSTWNPLYKFNPEQSTYIKQLAAYQASLPPDKQGYIPPEFKIRLAILNGKAEQIKQETEAVAAQDRMTVRASYEKAFGTVLTDDLIKGKTPEGQAAAINFSGPMTVEQAADAVKGLVYSNMGGRWWTSNFDATAAQAQDRVDRLLAAATQVAVTKVDLPPDQTQLLVDQGLQTYENYKAAEHAVVDAGADAAFAAVGVVTFIPALAGAIETGGASLVGWAALMATVGGALRPGVKALLMGGEYDWKQNLLKDASIGAIELPTYVLGPGLILRATKAFAEPALAAVKALRFANNPEINSMIMNRTVSALEQASKLAPTVGQDIVAGIKVATNFKGLTGEAMAVAVKESTDVAARKAFTDVFSKISSQLKAAGGKPFSSESIAQAAANFSDEVMPKVIDDIMAQLSKTPTADIQALVQDSLKKAITQMADSGAFSAESVIRALATAETENVLSNTVSAVVRQGFARNSDIPEGDLVKALLKVTDDPAQAALLAQALKAEIPNTAAMTSSNLMDIFIKKYPQIARAFAYTAPAGLAGAASAPVRYEWDRSLTFEQNMANMRQQAIMGALISMAMVGSFTVPGSLISHFKGRGIKGFGIADSIHVDDIVAGQAPKLLGKLEDGRIVKLQDGANVRIMSAGTHEATGLTVAAQDVKATVSFIGGRAHVVSDADSLVPAQVFRNGKWEKLAPDVPLEHGQMIRFGDNGESLVFMRASEAGKDSAFLLPVPKLEPSVARRVIPAVVEEAGFQPGSRLRITPGRDVATIGGVGADVRLGATHMVEASMPVIENKGMIRRWLTRNADEVAPLAAKGEVNLRNIGDQTVTVFRKDAKGNILGTDIYPSLKSLQADANRLGNAVPAEAPKFRIGVNDEVMFGLSGKKFQAYSQNGAIRLERLADAGSNIPVARSTVATVLRASADDMGRVERAINFVRNQGSDAIEATRAGLIKTADLIRSGDLIDRLTNGQVIGRVLRNSDFEKAATLSDKRLISLGFGRIDTPSGVTGTLYRNYKTGVEILRDGERVLQVTANGKTLKVNWDGDKVTSFIMPDGTLRSVVPRGGKFNAPSLAELGPVEDGRIRLYRATYDATTADLAKPLSAVELQRLEAIKKKIAESGEESLSRLERIQYGNLKPYVQAADPKKFYTSLEEALEAAGKREDGIRPTILVFDDVRTPSHVAGGYDLPADLALQAKQHPQSFTNTLNNGTWMTNVTAAEASAATHYGAQIVRDVGFRINANGFQFLSGFSDAGMLARAKFIVDQATSRITRGVASRLGFSHLINMGERIDIGTAFGSEILSRNKFVAGRTASLLKTKDGLKLIAGEGDIVVIRNGVRVVLTDGQAMLQSGDRIIVGKHFGNGLYKGDEFVVALDSTKSVLQHTRTASNLRFLYAGPGGRVPVGLMATVAKRNLSSAANDLLKVVGRAKQTVWNFGGNAKELARHIATAMREGRVHRALDKGKEYTIFGTGRLSREGDQVKLRQIKPDEQLTIVRKVEGKKIRIIQTRDGKSVDLVPGDLIYKGRILKNPVKDPFEYRGPIAKAPKVPLRERLGKAVDTVKGLEVKKYFGIGVDAVTSLPIRRTLGTAVTGLKSLGSATVDHIKRAGLSVVRTPRAIANWSSDNRQALLNPLRTAQARMASVEARAPMTEIERKTAELAAAFKAQGIGEPVQAFRLRTPDAKVRPAALHKDGTAISFASKADDAASDLVPIFKPLEPGSSETQIVIKNAGGRRTVVAPVETDYRVSIVRPGSKPINVENGTAANWQEGDKLLITRARDGKTTTLEFEKSSAYRNVVASMSDLTAEVGRDGLLRSVWAARSNWWSSARKYMPTFRRKAVDTADTIAPKVKELKFNRKGSIKIDSETRVKLAKAPEGGVATAEVSSTVDLLVRRGKDKWVPEISGKATLQPGDRFRVGRNGRDYVFTGTSLERVTPKEAIIRPGAFREMYRRLRNPAEADINILRRATTSGGDTAEGAGNFYSVKMTINSKPLAITNNGALSSESVSLATLPYRKEPHAMIYAAGDGVRVTRLQINTLSDVPMFVTNAEGNLLTRVKYPTTDLPENSFLKIGDEVFQVVRKGNDLVLDQVQATRLTQKMMRPTTVGAVEVVEKSFVQANRAKAAAVASNFEVAGSATTYKIKGNSITLGAKQVAVIEKTELSEFAAKQAKISFEPEGVFVEALSDKPVYILRKSESGQDVAELLAQGNRYKFDPETMSVRLGDKDNNGRSVFRLKPKETEPRSSTAGPATLEEEIANPIGPRTSIPEGDKRAPRVVILDRSSSPAPIQDPIKTDLDLKKEIGAIFKNKELVSSPESLESAIKAVLARVDYSSSANQVSNDLKSALKNLSLDLRYAASSDESGNIVIKALRPGKQREFSLQFGLERVSNPKQMKDLADEIVNKIRVRQNARGEYNPTELFEGLDTAMVEMARFGEPQNVVKMIKNKLKAIGLADRVKLSVDGDRFRLFLREAGEPEERALVSFNLTRDRGVVDAPAETAAAAAVKAMDAPSPITATSIQSTRDRLTQIIESHSDESVRNQLTAVLKQVDANSLTAKELADIQFLAERGNLPLSSLKNLYSGLLENNSLSPQMRTILQNAQSELSAKVVTRAREIADLMFSNKVTSRDLVRIAKENSSAEFLTEELSQNYLRLAAKNVDAISTADALDIRTFLQQSLAKFPNLAPEAEQLLTALNSKNELFRDMLKFGKMTSSSRSADDLVKAVTENAAHFDDASLAELAKAMKKGHLTLDSSQTIANIVYPRINAKPFSDAAENAFASAHLEFLAKNSGATTDGLTVFGVLAKSLQDENAAVSIEMVNALTSVIRTGKFSSEVVPEISKLISLMQSKPSFTGLLDESKGALVDAIRRLQTKFLPKATDKLTLSSNVVTGDALKPTIATDALIISGNGRVTDEAFAASSSLRQEFEKSAKNTRTQDITPGDVHVLRNSDQALPYNTVAVIGEDVTSRTKFSETFAKALLKLEKDGKVTVASPVIRLDLLRQIQKRVSEGATNLEAYKFSEDDLIREYVQAVRAFRAESNGDLKRFTIIVPPEEKAFGDRLNLAIESAMREEVMVAPGKAANTIDNPSNIRPGRPVK